MAHFAQLDENNIVVAVIVINNEDILDENGQEQESVGLEYIRSVLKDETKWVQTSYNDSFRVRYAGIGYTYNVELDAFIPPKPFPSWDLVKETADWQSPLGSAPQLTEEQIASKFFYKWDEDIHQADNTTGWILITCYDK